jgi:transcriptional regulator NrdR family protein
MRIQTTTIEFSPRVAPPACCPSCSEPLIAALASEFVDEGEIRHHWVCEACGEDFSTTVIIRH